MGQAMGNVGNALGDVFNKSSGPDGDQFSLASKIGMGAAKGGLQGYSNTASQQQRQQNMYGGNNNPFLQQMTQQPQPLLKNPYFYGGQ
jgi:hypothetical protein